MKKLCIICSKEFNTNTNTKTCSEICNKESKRIRLSKNYLDNKDKRSEKRKENFKKFHIENPDYRKNYMKKYRKTENNKNYNRERTKTEKYKEVRNKRSKERYTEDILYKISCSIRKTINKAIRRNNFEKKSKTVDILGCSFDYFKNFIENKFEVWMNWENYGKYNGELNYGWDIDHIIPLSSAKTEDDILKLNHFTNLQPLCSKINRDIKINKI
jgi:hypothetical protein